MSFLEKFLTFLPEVKGPKEKRLSFNTKLKWTLIILVSFFILGVVPLYGLGANSLSQFEQLSLILGASFGSITSLGIGPIVTASIVLQLLNGSGILKLDTTTPEGRRRFQGLQKIMILAFIIFESMVYVLLGGLSPSTSLNLEAFRLAQILLIFQLFLGGLMILYMDEVINKWGFGSGVSLFIAAGVSSQVFIRAFSPLTAGGLLAFGSGEAPIGQIWVFFQSLIGRNPTGALLAATAILATIIIFLLSVYFQAMKVEIPLSFGRIRGHGIRWPLRFLYTSNMPVILIAALLANIQLVARLLESSGRPWLGTFAGNAPATGIITWIFPPQIISNLITQSVTILDLARAGTYTLLMVGGAVLFSYFWVQTSGMDASSQAKQIMASGLQIPGFRRDQRVLEQILSRYITPLTIMGGMAIGILAASADLLGALTSGTGLLLTVMIIYRLYEEIAQRHMMDMYPALRKVME